MGRVRSTVRDSRFFIVLVVVVAIVVVFVLIFALDLRFAVCVGGQPSPMVSPKRVLRDIHEAFRVDRTGEV